MLSFGVILGLLLVSVAMGVGAVATIHNVRTTRGPKERAYVIKVCIGSWALILSMLVFLYYLPSPYRYIALLLYLTICPILLYRWSTVHQLIRMLEEREEERELESGERQ